MRQIHPADEPRAPSLFEQWMGISAEEWEALGEPEESDSSADDDQLEMFDEPASQG